MNDMPKICKLYRVKGLDRALYRPIFYYIHYPHSTVISYPGLFTQNLRDFYMTSIGKIN